MEDSSHLEMLTPESARQISKNIATIIYDVVPSKDTVQTNQRLDVLMMLHKWCSNSSHHFIINVDNYDRFVDALANITSPSTPVQSKVALTTVFDDHETLTLDTTLTVMDFYRKFEAINKEKSKILEIIRERDRRKFGGNNMFDSSYYMWQHGQSFNFSDLESLSNQSQCSNKTAKVAKCNQMLPRSSGPALSGKLVHLGYSLLNLKRTPNEMKLLSNIIKRLSSHRPLNASEMNFVDYLWYNHEKLDLPPEVPLLLLENFCFIYENCFINACTNALRTNSSSIPQEAYKILMLASENEKLQRNIVNLLHELYACSEYNSKLNIFLSLIY